MQLQLSPNADNCQKKMYFIAVCLLKGMEGDKGGKNISEHKSKHAHSNSQESIKMSSC